MHYSNLQYSTVQAMSKVAEKVIHSQLMKYMEESGQLSQNIHGYRSNHSTVTAMLQISDSILQAADVNSISTLVMIDESAAFDCVNVEILDKKLESLQCGSWNQKLNKILHDEKGTLCRDRDQKIQYSVCE